MLLRPSPHPLRVALVAALCLCSLTLAGGATAETEDQKEQRAQSIIHAVNSPFCPASTLASCGSPQAAAWRGEIQQWVNEGLSRGEICARLEARVGQRLCAMPTSSWGAAFPLLLSLLAIAALGVLLRRLVGRAPRAPVATRAVEPGELDAVLDRELAELDEDER